MLLNRRGFTQKARFGASCSVISNTPCCTGLFYHEHTENTEFVQFPDSCLASIQACSCFSFSHGHTVKSSKGLFQVKHDSCNIMYIGLYTFVHQCVKYQLDPVLLWSVYSLKWRQHLWHYVAECQLKIKQHGMKLLHNAAYPCKSKYSPACSCYGYLGRMI